MKDFIFEEAKNDTIHEITLIPRHDIPMETMKNTNISKFRRLLWGKTRSYQDGFTLVETMVVVALISLMIFFAASDMGGFGPNMRARQAARDLHTNLMRMKAEATKRNRNVVITLNPVLCNAHPSNVVPSPGGTYVVFIDENGDFSFNGSDSYMSMEEESGDAAPDTDYDLLRNTALCQAGGTVSYKFTPEALWRDSTDTAVATTFQIQNDRGRAYTVAVSLTGAITTTKL